MIEMLNCDCMEYMAGLPDKAFDLAIVDPPYQLDRWNHEGNNKKRIGSTEGRKRDKWDKMPKPEYFDELFRVSKEQIVWGGNYFNLGRTVAPILWDKKNVGTHFADGEYAWTSFKTGTLRIYRLHISSTEVNTERFHPTQKPVALYKWLLSRYAKPGDKILDTHGGSGSICIACHDLGYDLTWMELDADYYKAAVARYQNHAAQGTLFDQAELTRSNGWKA